MDFQKIQNKINKEELRGSKAKKLIYDYLHLLNRGCRRGNRNYTTQFLTDCARNLEIIEVYKMGENESECQRVFVFSFHD